MYNKKFKIEGIIVEKIKNIKLSKQTLKEWEDKFIPNFDYFYFEDVEHARSLLQSNGFILLRDELARDMQLNTFDTSTAFSPWNVNRNAKYVAVISNEDFNKIDLKNRKEVFHLQWSLGRGQVWDIEVLHQFVGQSSTILDDYTFSTEGGDKVIIQKSLWIQLSHIARENFLKYVANLFIDEDTTIVNLPETIEQYPLLEPYINCFPSKSGPNCLASVLGALEDNESSRDWIMNQWVQQKTFLMNLDLHGYKELTRITDTEQLSVNSRDVIVWLSSEEMPLHACFVLNNKTVFNKNGQMMFNPWQALSIETIMDTWKEVQEQQGSIAVYRRDFT